MRSRYLTGVTMFAVLASAPTPIPLAMAHSKAAPDQGFCRNAAPLPQLDPEVRPVQPQTSGGLKTTGGSKRDPEVIVYCDENEFTVTMISKLLKFEILRNAVEDVGDKRGLYYLDESCRTFTGGSTRESGSFGKMGGVVLRR